MCICIAPPPPRGASLQSADHAGSQPANVLNEYGLHLQTSCSIDLIMMGSLGSFLSLQHLYSSYQCIRWPSVLDRPAGDAACRTTSPVCSILQLPASAILHCAPVCRKLHPAGSQQSASTNLIPVVPQCRLCQPCQRQCLGTLHLYMGFKVWVWHLQ